MCDDDSVFAHVVRSTALHFPHQLQLRCWARLPDEEKERRARENGHDLENSGLLIKWAQWTPLLVGKRITRRS